MRCMRAMISACEAPVAGNQSCGCPSSDAPGAAMTAVEAINHVRSRYPGLAPVQNQFTSSKEIFRDRIRNERNVELANAFHAPFTIDSGFRPNSLRKEAAKKGKNIIVYEGGESLRFDQQAIEEGLAGTLRLMKYLEMIDWAPDPSEENKTIWSTTWIRSKNVCTSLSSSE